MKLPPEVWIVLSAYVVFALGTGVLLARRASQNVDEYFLSGRRLPWWVAGTSMVATTFASDTPLVITGWVRDHGIWQNWQWWCLAGGSALTMFLFARYWRRGRVMTSVELAELRYGGADSKLLRLVQGVFQAGITNTIILCWVILAAAKILDVLFDVDKVLAVSVACGLALGYSLLAGFWGVVVTDVVQFLMAMGGALALAVAAWQGVGGVEGLAQVDPGQLAFLPAPGEGTFTDASFWSVPLVTVCVLLGVQWWANDQVDGGGLAVQRIAASRTEQDGVLACLWFSVAHYALRPWPWILVGLASISVLPHLELTAPVDAVVTEVDAAEGRLVLAPTSGADPAEAAATDPVPEAGADGAGGVEDPLDPPPGDPAPGDLTLHFADVEGAAEDWAPHTAAVAVGSPVTAGTVLARTDSERAYVVMARRYLTNPWLLALLITSLLAAFMSTVDTHTNLAASFFVNDLYRRFLVREASPRHYVNAGRVASAGALALAGLLAWKSESISGLFTFFLAFLAGVGPIYVLRWLWWRVRAFTEIVAMVSSAVAATWLTLDEPIVSWLDARGWGWEPLERLAAYAWPLGPLAEGGEPTVMGRLVLTVTFSLACSLLSLLLLPRPKPARLVEFYRRVRPVGWWGPVRRLCPEIEPPHEAGAILRGVVGSLLLIYGLLFGLGAYLLERRVEQVVLALLVAWAGQMLVSNALRVFRDVRLEDDADGDPGGPDDGTGAVVAVAPPGPEPDPFARPISPPADPYAPPPPRPGTGPEAGPDAGTDRESDL